MEVDIAPQFGAELKVAAPTLSHSAPSNMN